MDEPINEIKQAAAKLVNKNLPEIKGYLTRMYGKKEAMARLADLAERLADDAQSQMESLMASKMAPEMAKNEAIMEMLQFQDDPSLVDEAAAMQEDETSAMEALTKFFGSNPSE